MGDTMRLELARNLGHLTSAIRLSAMAMHAKTAGPAKVFVDEARVQTTMALTGFQIILENIGAGPRGREDGD